MREDFLHFLWRTRRFNTSNLSTTEAQTVEILHPGEHNTHAGPDFFNARVRIDGTTWAGNVEMHLRSSEWAAHGHSTDRAYDNVVLHVIWDDDAPVHRADGQLIPTLILKGHVGSGLLQSYQRLLHEQDWVPCAPQFGQTPAILRLNWFDRLAIERLEHKTNELETMLIAAEHHWEELFYRVLARAFGLKVNTEPFEALARSLPIGILARHKNQLFQIEALLFGQAGMLEGELKDEYPRQLAREYRFLQHKYGLVPLAASQWKFLRLRPANFPTVRIAQFAGLIAQSSHLFAQVIDARTLREAEHLFRVELGGYWREHYRFDAPSTVSRVKSLGPDFVHLLSINALIPILFFYGRQRQLPQLEEKALRWLESMPPESNTVLEAWGQLGAEPANGMEAQALLHLKKHYCDQRACLDCAVGGYLLR